VHARPSTGRFGCMCSGAPIRATRAEMPRRSGVHAHEEHRGPRTRARDERAVRVPCVVQRVVGERHRRAEAHGAAAVAERGGDPLEGRDRFSGAWGHFRKSSETCLTRPANAVLLH
jgi:hypothetical protein